MKMHCSDFGCRKYSGKRRNRKSAEKIFGEGWRRRKIALALLCSLALGLAACGKKQLMDADLDKMRQESENKSEQEGQDKDGEINGGWKEGEGIPMDGDSNFNAVDANAKDLMQDAVASGITVTEGKLEQNINAIADFAVRLFQSSAAEDSKGNKNTLLSPISVLYALAMTANGAKDNTKLEMEKAFGLSLDELNASLLEYRELLPCAEKYKVSLANSIWIAEGRKFLPDPAFLQKNADYYKADMYQAVFDENTKQAMNAWVKDRTDGMILEILDEIPEDAVMYLVNAVSFDAEWQKIYEENQIYSGEFANVLGEREKTEFMRSEEFCYLTEESADGFMKYYADGKYAFAALLPKEGVGIDEYVSSLTGEKLQRVLKAASRETVQARMPKFSSSSSYTMNDALIQMGMRDAFDKQQADFSGMGTVPEDENLLIGRVLHKAKIEVNERGTKAGAATVVEMRNYATSIREIKYVTLDRPFVYMIVDCETNLPLFLGTVKRITS